MFQNYFHYLIYILSWFLCLYKVTGWPNILFYIFYIKLYPSEITNALCYTPSRRTKQFFNLNNKFTLRI